MKNFSICLILLSSLILISCGTTASYTGSSTIQDGIYYNPDYAAIKAATEAEQTHIAQLTNETKASKIYREPVDTIVLGETRNVNIPLEPEKTYVVLLEGETYEERLNKFDEGSDRTFSINFEYNFGYGYDWGWNPYYYHHTPSYYWWHRPSYYWGWYDPWYSPWYYPGFYPGYYAGYYPPYYDPWYGPMYPPMYLPPPPPPGPGGAGHKGVVHGRRDIARTTPAAAPASHRESVRRAPVQQGINQVRGNGSGSNTQTASSTQRRGIRDAKQGNSSDKYRQSATQTQKGTTRSSGSYTNSSNQRYQSSQGQSSRSTYNQNRSNSYSGRSSSYSSGSSYRSSGNTSGSGATRTGGRR